MAKKLYYKIGEACKILEIQPYVLRYWETEFPFLSPNKSKSGQRVYNDSELDVIRRIKELLYEEGYTIAGAKKKLEAELEAGPQAEAEDDGKKSAKARTPRPTRAPAAEGEETVAEEPAETDGALDTRTAERIKHLRAGVEGALDQARAILEILGS